MAAGPGMAWSTAVVAFVGAVPLWRYTTNAITVAHEGGHAVFGLLFGSAVKHVKIFHGGGGEMVPGRESWLSKFVSLVAGYLGPSIFGFAGVLLLVHGADPRAVLYLSLAFLAGVLIMVRNLFGVFVILFVGAILWVVALHSAAAVQLVFAYVWVWFLLMGGVRQVPELFWAMHTDPATDAGLLQQHTYIGDVVWLFLFWLLSLGALVYGGALLLRH